MSNSKPDTIPLGTIESCVLPSSMEESVIIPDKQLQIDPNVTESSAAETIGSDADELIINAGNADGSQRCGSKAADVTVDNESGFAPQVSDLENLQNPCDAKNEHQEVTINAQETKNCAEAQNEESSSEVAEFVEKIVNEADSESSNESLPTAQDENEGGDTSQNTTQLQSADSIANNGAAHTKTDEMKDVDYEQIQAADANNVPPRNIRPSVGREILFTDQGWSQRWSAFRDKEVCFTAPVLRVEAGRFFWSSETYNKRILSIYKRPDVILVLRLPDADEVKILRGSQASGNSSFLIAESVIDPKTSKIRLSQLTHPTSLPLNRAGGIKNIRKRTCFDILTPTEVIELSAAFLPDDSFDNIEYASEKCLSDTYRFEHAISESLLTAHMDSYNTDQEVWRHQVILGTPHSYVIGGNDQVLKEALASALELQKSRGGGDSKLDSNIIDERDTSGYTAIHYACRDRRSSTVSILVGAGSNCSIQTADLKTPCHLSALGLDAASLSIILSAHNPRPDPNALDSNLRTPMFVAAVEGRTADGKNSANALDQCLSALEAWGGQLMLGNTTDLHPVHLVWKAAELGVILSHCRYHYPLLSGLAGISVSALHHYPLHGALIDLREKIFLALSSTDAFTSIPSEIAIVSRLQILLIHGFEPNERLEGIFCEGIESNRLTAYLGFTPLQILIAAAIEVKMIDSSDLKEKDNDYVRAVKNIIETIQSCAKILMEKGARVNMPPPPVSRLDRNTPPGCYSFKDAMEGAQNAKIPPVSRDGLKNLDNKQILTLLVGADHMKAPLKLFSSLPKSINSVGTLQSITTSRYSNAPGGSDDCSCAICWSEFGLISNRKHLCRVSGRYVCNDCSTKRLLENGTEQRISDGLYNLATFEQKSGNRKTKVTSRDASVKSASTSTSDRNRSFLGLGSSSGSSATDKKEQRNLSATERITSAISGLGQAKDAVIERGAKLEGLAEKTEALNNASIDFMNMAKELERQQNSWW